MLPLNPFSHNPLLILIVKLIDGMFLLFYPLYWLINAVLWISQLTYMTYQYGIHLILFYFIKSEQFYLLRIKTKPFLIKIIKNPSLILFKEAIKKEPRLYKYFENKISNEWKCEAIKSNVKVMEFATYFTIPMHLEYLECEKDKYSCYLWDQYLPAEYKISNNQDEVINFLKLRLESDDFSTFLNKN